MDAGTIVFFAVVFGIIVELLYIHIDRKNIVKYCNELKREADETDNREDD